MLCVTYRGALSACVNQQIERERERHLARRDTTRTSTLQEGSLQPLSTTRPSHTAWRDRTSDHGLILDHVQHTRMLRGGVGVGTAGAR
jgi:hypothetical protein